MYVTNERLLQIIILIIWRDLAGLETAFVFQSTYFLKTYLFALLGDDACYVNEKDVDDYMIEIFGYWINLALPIFSIRNISRELVHKLNN